MIDSIFVNNHRNKNQNLRDWLVINNIRNYLIHQYKINLSSSALCYNSRDIFFRFRSCREQTADKPQMALRTACSSASSTSFLNRRRGPCCKLFELWLCRSYLQATFVYLTFVRVRVRSLLSKSVNFSFLCQMYV